MNDTSPEAKAKQFEIIFSKTEAERFKMGLEMMEEVRLIVLEGIRQQHPGISEVNLKIEFFKRYYTNDFTQDQSADIIRWIKSKYE